MKIVGCDLGKKGAICLLDTETQEIEIHDLKLDEYERLDAHWLFHLLLDKEVSHLIIEDVFRSKSLIHQAGAVIAVCQILQIQIKLTAICTWKKKILGSNTNNKEISINKCLELFPQTKELLTKPRARTFSDDRAESVLICQFLAQTL